MKNLPLRFIPLPDDRDVAEYLVDRSEMGVDERLYLAVPEVRSRKDAFLLAIHMLAQDSPIPFFIGSMAFCAMLVHLWAKFVLFLWAYF